MGNSAPSSGIIGVIFLGVAVVLVLIVHTSISIISRRRFARRFERLVQNGRVIPVLSSEEGPNASKLRKVTKVREVWVRASVSILDWMVSRVGNYLPYLNLNIMINTYRIFLASISQPHSCSQKPKRGGMHSCTQEKQQTSNRRLLSSICRDKGW